MAVDEDFSLVRCHDLSTSGISFYWPTAPKFDHVIVALAAQKGTTRVLAHVVFAGKQPDATGEYLVGCRFLRRLCRAKRRRGGPGAQLAYFRFPLCRFSRSCSPLFPSGEPARGGPWCRPAECAR